MGTAEFQSTSDVFAHGNYQFSNQRFADALDDMAGWGEAMSDADIALLGVGDVSLGQSFCTIPLPASFWLFGSAIAGLST